MRQHQSHSDGAPSAIRVLEPDLYPIRSPQAIPTPRLLVFRSHVEENLRRMKAILEDIAPGSGFRHLCPHVKTHKSSWVTGLMLDAGITHFKATPNELEMLLRAGAADVLVAYPLVPHSAAMVAQLAQSYPKAMVSVQVSCPEHVTILQDIAERYAYRWNVFLDLDVGMARTGAAIEEVGTVVNRIQSAPALQFVGVHAYDGHNHASDPDARRRGARQSMARLVSAMELLEQRGLQVGRVVAGGSPTFQPDLAYLLHEAHLSAQVQVSPGTWIYWDSKYDHLMPGQFVMAAVILAQVVDRPAPQRITLNLGHKRWGFDQGPVEVFSADGLRLVGASEEHTVLETDDPSKFEIGDYVLIAPRHVCSTVNLWEYTTVIDPEGRVEIESCFVDARNR